MTRAKPPVKVQYTDPWPADELAPRVLPDDITVTPQEAAEYWAFCSGEPLGSEAVTEAQCWQFAVLKHGFFLNETIPIAEKFDRSRTLTAWHPIVCKYWNLGPEYGAEWLKNAARRCLDLTYSQLEFLQPLAFGEPPKPVPEAVLREIRDSLQQQVQQQQTILAQLRRQRVPLWVQAGKEMKLLWPDEICFITSETKTGLEIYTMAGERWPSFQTLAALEQQLAAEPDFMRTSRQHLVNLSRIALVQPAGRGRDLTFTGLPSDIKARVTDGYLKAFLERLQG